MFEGFRYATSDEVVALWNNFGIDLSENGNEYLSGALDPAVITATGWLGNTVAELGIIEFPNGVLGFTRDPLPYVATRIQYLGASHYSAQFVPTGAINGYITNYGLKNRASRPSDLAASVGYGHYLVATSVPVPQAFWLFVSGLLVYSRFIGAKPANQA